MIELEKSGLNRFTKISTIANMKPIFCSDKDKIETAVEKLIKANHRSLPIINSKEKIVGILTATDILDSFLIGQDFTHKISEIMHHDVLTVEFDNTIGYVLQKFKMSRRGRMPVKKGDKLVGMISENDIVKFFVNVNFQSQISSIMTMKPLFTNSSTSILTAIKTVVNTHYRRIPIVDGGKLVGLIMANDLLRILKERNYRFSMLQDSLYTAMIKNVITIKKDYDVSAAIKMMLVHEIDGVIVSDSQKLEGIITERNILEQIN